MVKFLQQFFAFYINSSIHVSLAVCALVGLTALQLAIDLDRTLLFFVFFATITGYNFTKYAPVAKMHHRSLTPSLRLIQIFSLGCFMTMCYFGFQLSQKVIVVIIPFLVLTIGYVIPVFSGAKTLRTLPGFKIVVIAICWVGVTVLLPVIHHGILLSWDVVIVGIQRLLFVIAITIPFEIRDLHYDSTALKTVPQLIGVERSKKVGVAFLIASVLLMVVLPDVSNYEVISMLIVLLIAIIFIVKTEVQQTRYFCAFWVESLPIMWWGIVVLCHVLFR